MCSINQCILLYFYDHCLCNMQDISSHCLILPFQEFLNVLGAGVFLIKSMRFNSASALHRYKGPVSWGFQSSQVIFWIRVCV